MTKYELGLIFKALNYNEEDYNLINEILVEFYKRNKRNTKDVLLNILLNKIDLGNHRKINNAEDLLIEIKNNIINDYIKFSNTYKDLTPEYIDTDFLNTKSKINELMILDLQRYMPELNQNNCTEDDELSRLLNTFDYYTNICYPIESNDVNFQNFSEDITINGSIEENKIDIIVTNKLNNTISKYIYFKNTTQQVLEYKFDDEVTIEVRHLISPVDEIVSFTHNSDGKVFQTSYDLSKNIIQFSTPTKKYTTYEPTAEEISKLKNNIQYAAIKGKKSFSDILNNNNKQKK